MKTYRTTGSTAPRVPKLALRRRKLSVSLSGRFNVLEYLRYKFGERFLGTWRL